MSVQHGMEQSVREALDDYTTPASALDQELAMLWDDLSNARRTAVNGEWSIRCEAIVYRIATLTTATKRPTEWQHIPVDLLIDGSYEEIHAAIGMSTPLTVDARRRAQEIANR